MSCLFGCSIFEIVATVTTLIIGVIAYCKWKLSYWDRVGLPTLPATIPFGNVTDLMLQQKSFGEQFRDLYNEFKEKGHRRHAGIYFFLTPHYMVIDPVLIKNVMQKDFQHFVNHNFYFNAKDDPLSAHLFNLEDEEWREMRVKVTPTFTSGKMKMMFQTLADCAVGLKDIMNTSAANHNPVEINDVLRRFTTDIIGSTAFGIECNTLKNPDAQFNKIGRRVFEDTNFERMKGLLTFLLPHGLLRVLRFKINKPDCEEFFMKIVRDTVNYRERNNIYRKDFMHLLLQLKNRGAVTDDDRITDAHGQTKKKTLTMNELAAQVFVFFLAGFETSSTAMTFASYELAVNPDIQEKLREEIISVLSKHNDTLTYDAIMEMTFMDKVLQETLRKYPPLSLLTRKCTKDYLIPDTNIVIKKGTDVVIPIFGLQRDPEYYPNPDKFDPERFSEENKQSRPTFSWIPFGEGPRICIGMRFGMLQSKVGLTTLLKSYKIKLNQKTSLPLKMDPKSFMTAVEGGVWLDVEKIN